MALDGVFLHFDVNENVFLREGNIRFYKYPATYKRGLKVSSWLSSQVSPISLIGVRQVLSIAGWWVTVVMAIQDQTSGPSGLRFKGRDVTVYI